MARWSSCLASALLLVGILAAPVMAQEEKELGWADIAELSLVVTDGNSEAQTVGLNNLLSYLWEKARFDFTVNVVRTKTNNVDRFAIGDADDYRIVEVDNENTDPERYFADARYAREISERFFWYGGASWERNRPAAVEARSIVSGGVGNIWLSREDLKFSTAYGVTYTDQEDTTGESNDFAGLRFSWDYEHKFGANTTYVNTLVIDESLDETSDWRADMINSVAVAMSNHLALKVSLRTTYDNEPSFEEVDLFPDSMSSATGKVLAQLDELDTTFTASLVVNF